jgi:hypothetical protein
MQTSEYLYCSMVILFLTQLSIPSTENGDFENQSPTNEPTIQHISTYIVGCTFKLLVSLLHKAKAL